MNKISQPGLTGNLADYLALPRTTLQSPGQYFDEICKGIDLPAKIVSLLMLTSFFLFIYGALLGSGHPLQAISSAFKLPLVFLGSLFACAPALYIFDILLGSKRGLGQTLAILLTAMSVTAVLLFGFAPIAIVLKLAVVGFQFFKVLNVGFLGIAMLVGLLYLEQGLRRTSATDSNGLLREVVYAFWIILLLFMISQLAWCLRPFFYYPGASFTLVVGSSGNLLKEFGSAAGEFLGFWTVR
jgi:hypothetical protein